MTPEIFIEKVEARRMKKKHVERRRRWEAIGCGLLAAFVLFFPYLTEKSNFGLTSFALVVFFSGEVQKRWRLEDAVETLDEDRRKKTAQAPTP